MNNKSVQLWAPGLDFSAQVLLYRLDHEDAFEQNVRPNISAETQVHKILPNGYGFIQLIKVYFYLKEDKEYSWLDSDSHGLEGRYVWLARNFVRLKNSLNIWDDRGALTAVLVLLKEKALLHPDQVCFLEFCKNFIENIIRPMLWGSPLLLTSPSPVARGWWLQSNTLSAEVDQQLQELKRSFQSPLPEVISEKFFNWLMSLKTWLNSNLFVSSPPKALREGSAMCHRLSIIHYSLGHYTLAILLCHRALDLLLFAECASAKLVNFTANHGGGELNQPINGDRHITVTNCYNALINSGQYLPNNIRWSRFDNLNKYRNLVFLTHYFGSLSSSAAKVLLMDVAIELKAIGGASWELASNSILRKIQLEDHEFFSLSDTLMDVVVPV